MPRLRRVLFGALLLGIAGYVVWDWIEARRLAADIAQIAARGEPTGLDETRVPLTGEQRDAARIYAAAVARFEDDTRDEPFRYRTLDVDNPAGAPGRLDELETRYRKDAPALQLLDQATPLDFAGFGEVAPELTARQDPLVGLSALNALRADLLSMRGRGDAAVDVLVASVRLQRTMPSSLSRYFAASRVLGSLRILLRHTNPTEAALVKLQRAYEALPDTDTMTQEMMASRAEFLDAIARPGRTPGEAAAGRVLRPWFTSQSREQLAIFDEALSFTRAPLPERFDRTAAFERRIVADVKRFDRRARFFAWLAPRRGAAFGGTSLPAAAYGLAVRRIAITALAVERYRRANGGACPASLDALVPAYLPAVPQDPFSGKPLIYGKGADDYRLYSVDNNRVDDGGALYGIGSRGQQMPRTGEPRDYGIRVPLQQTVNREP